MTRTLSSIDTLDAVLALQLTVAWAGEGLSSPPRLGWWQTDLLDPDGGGDLMQRLLPRTHAWASLGAVREAARRTDEKARRALAASDDMRTLFFFGFEVDEALAERLADLRRSGRTPAEALDLPVDMAKPFSREDLAAALTPPGKAPKFEVVPGGRQLAGSAPAAPDALARALAAALVPLADRYPMPFFRIARA